VRGDEVILHKDAHIFNYEAGASALLSGVQVRPILGEKCVVSPKALRAVVRTENVHFPRPKLLCLENAHNVAGGRVFPLEEFAAVAAEARSLGLEVHLDGARLFNAEVAGGVPAREWCEHADTVSVCSSKGLSAPVGSLLAGNEATIREARRVRKAFGGEMRQAGVIAVASLYAFEHHVGRLAEDHERARRLAVGLVDIGYAVEPPETNIVLVRVEEPRGFLRALTREGVLATPAKAGHVRLCTHLDISDQEIDAVVEAAARLAAHSLEP
jgi:threonine aldolase